MPIHITRIVLTIILLLGCCAHAEVHPLAPDKAFDFSTGFNQQGQLIAQWKIAPGYYLYKNKIHLGRSADQLDDPSIVLPAGEAQTDEINGSYQVYKDIVQVVIPGIKKDQAVHLWVGYQGCSKDGFCYAPIRKTVAIPEVDQGRPKAVTRFIEPAHESMNRDWVTRAFDGHHPIVIVLFSFIGMGLLLAFTPCVLPMVPILSGIIVGHGKKNSGNNSFFLSLAYVLGVALTYAVIGMVIASLGRGIQADLQKPSVIILVSGLFVLLALSLFGLYELQLPARWQRFLVGLSNKQQGGHYFGVFIMGCLSTLIVSPCVSAPLVGVLAYIGQTGDVVLGGLALLALGIGMGIPLLLLGLSAHTLLPKAGPWMRAIEQFFGVIMLGIAIWMLSRMIPGPVTLFLWAMLLMGVAVFMGLYIRVTHPLLKGLAFIAFFYGAILVVGAMFGNTDPFHPLDRVGRFSRSPVPSVYFIQIRNLEELQQQLAMAKQEKKRVMLDFYADWCTACRVMDSHLFTESDVRQALAKWRVLRIDVTLNSVADRNVLQRFQVIGPPTILFFDLDSQELTKQRIVGEVSTAQFLKKLKEVTRANKTRI